MIARQDIVMPALKPLTRQLIRQRSMLLNEPDTAWIVESGTAVVFATMVEGDRPVGSRRKLFRVSEGDLISSLSTAQLAARALMLFAVSDLRLREMSAAELGQHCRTDDAPMREAVDHWMCRLADLLEHDPPPAAAERLGDEERIELEAEQALRVAGDGWRWLAVERGAVRINGRAEMPIAANEAAVPLGAGFWLHATQPTALRPLKNDERFAPDNLAASMSWLHTVVQHRLVALDEEDARRERMRIASRQQVQCSLVASAMGEVRSILHPEASLPQRETPLLSAMAVIGEALGVEAQPPAASEDLNLVRDPIDAIARAMRVRHRRVVLTGRWWNEDCGPLLAARRETHEPIALIKPTVGSYIAVDPTSNTTCPVDAATAASLAPEATMFYRPLPTRVTRPWHLLSLVRQRQGLDITFVIALALIATLLGFLTPVATGRLMDLAIPDANTRLVVELGLGLAAAAMGIALLQIAQAVLAVRIAIRAETVMEAGVWDRLLKLRPRFFSRFSTGDLLMRASAITQISREINGVTMRSLLSSLMGLLNLALLFYYSAKLAMIAIALVAVVAVVTGFCGSRVGSHARRLLQLRGRFFGMVVQIVSGVGKLRVAHAQERAFAIWMRRYAEQVRLTFRAHRAQDALAVFNHVLPTISSVALFWFAASMLLVDESDPGPMMTIGVFLAFNTAMGVFVASASELSLTLVGLVDTLINSRRLAPILAADPEVSDDAADPGRLTGHISLSRVRFRYHAEGPSILEGVDLVAEPGQFIALTGPSGCGKSTILRLLLGFETPESGVIAYDGQDLAGLDVTAVRRQIGVVLQSSRINTGSIFDNITGGLAVSMEQAWEAAEDAGLADDIRDMPMGMHTMISEGGSNISGGQRQRLFIARALVKRPRILLLDEATSALDNRTQQIVSRSLARRNVTRIVIAHRLSTIRDADRIYILERGCIVDQGTYDELKRTHDLFAMAA